MIAWIVRLIDLSRRHAWLTTACFALLVAASLGLANRHLSVDTDTDHMFASSLPWRQHQIEYSREFPQFDDLLVAVVRGASDEETAETADQLVRQAQADPHHFIDASRPDVGTLFQRDGLLLLPQDDLAQLINSLMTSQPLLGPLAADPTALGLLHTITLMTLGVQQMGADLSDYRKPLQQLADSLQNSADGHPTPLSWQALLGPSVAQQKDNVHFVLLHPRLDRQSLQPGQAATDRLQQIIQQLPDVKDHRVTVDYTGSIALSDVQFGAITDGIVLSTLGSILLLALWLFLALRSWRLIVPILITLVGGLVLTLGFAAITIGRLNLISIAFAVLFVGLAVDFAIQFTVRLREARLTITDLAEALRVTGRRSGIQITVAALATACGFLSFAPTSFVGVAELGIIAGIGMVLALICTLTLLPALLVLFHPRDEAAEVALPGGAAADRLMHRHQRALLVVFAVLGLAGIGSAITLPFDANPLHTQDPHSEPMRTLMGMAADPATNPFNIDILVPDLAKARQLTTQLEKLPEVASVLSAATFVPEDQGAKLDQLSQAQDLLLPSLQSPAGIKQPSPAAFRAAIADTRGDIRSVWAKLPADSPLRAIDRALAKLQTTSDANLERSAQALVRFLPMQLDSLREALNAQPITAQNLPAAVRQNWYTRDGRVHIQVSPTVAAQTSEGLHRFVQAVQAIAPDAGGPAVTTIASADTILHAFQQAGLLALIAISVVLLLILRNIRDAGNVLLTLLVSALLTALFARLAGMSINYANIIALPLLLGVGVSFNVYFVMNWRTGITDFIGSASARAVLFSALTTGTAFGSLALSHDLGMASMGSLLLLSLAAVLLATFGFLPVLLYAQRKYQPAPGHG
ncbi:MMPL family transporter [Frateuria aurantia]